MEARFYSMFFINPPQLHQSFISSSIASSKMSEKDLEAQRIEIFPSAESSEQSLPESSDRIDTSSQVSGTVGEIIQAFLVMCMQ